jgi:hypothetical protein
VAKIELERRKRIGALGFISFVNDEKFMQGVKN